MPVVLAHAKLNFTLEVSDYCASYNSYCMKFSLGVIIKTSKYYFKVKILNSYFKKLS